MIEPIPFRDFADLLMSPPEAWAKILQRIKFRERFAPPYAAARACIRKYVDGSASQADTLKRAATLRARPRARSGTAQRDIDSATMIEAFVRYFDRAAVEHVLDQPLQLSFGGVVVRVEPDFGVTRNGCLQFYKLIYAKAPLVPRQAKIHRAMAHLLFEAVDREHRASAEAFFYGVLHGRTMPCEPLDDSFRNQCIELAEQIQILWPLLQRQPPAGPSAHP